jgi:hypothetical protein
MSTRRFTRLTNAFSKKVKNLEHAIALHFVHYNVRTRSRLVRLARPGRCPLLRTTIARNSREPG